MSHPLVGLNCDVILRETGEEALRLNWAYADGVLRAGGLPVLLAPVEGEAALLEQIDGLDALVLTGGDDYDPALYGQEPHAAARLLHPRRSRFDVALARAAVRRGLPILGICGGAQVLNIALGGSLLQDIPSQRPSPVRHAPPGVGTGGREMTRSVPGCVPTQSVGTRGGKEGQVLHTVRVEAGSRLAGIVGAGPLETNSSHHQAVDRLAEGLRAVAWAEDGVIEAAEGTGQPFLLAIQWHPERLLDRPPHLALFRALMAAARRDGAEGHLTGGGDLAK
jgi:putative glutamine amidotransferase